MTAIFTRQSAAALAARAETQARKGDRAFSFCRAINGLKSGTPIDGYEAEVLAELKRSIGSTGGNSLPIPIELLSDPTIRPDVLARDMSKGTLASGGYMVGASMSPVLDLLRPWSVVARAGVTLVPLSGGSDLAIPKTATGMTGYWLASESTAITQSDPTLGQIVMTPKNVGGLTKFSRLLMRQSNVADAFLQRELLMSIGRTIDAAVLNGSGASGQPTGLESTASVNATTGAFSLTTALTMEEAAATQGGADEQIAFVATPTTRKTLKGRTTDAGLAGEPLWKSSADGDTMAGRRAHVATYGSSATVYCGPWNDCLFALWNAPVLELNPFEATDFKTGAVIARMLMSVDIAFGHPSAWSKHTALT